MCFFFYVLTNQQVHGNIDYRYMRDWIMYLLIVVLIFAALAAFKGETWFMYKFRYVKRLVYHFFGFCPTCGCKLNFTPLGRPVCTNGDCKK